MGSPSSALATPLSCACNVAATEWRERNAPLTPRAAPATLAVSMPERASFHSGLPCTRERGSPGGYRLAECRRSTRPPPAAPPSVPLRPFLGAGVGVTIELAGKRRLPKVVKNIRLRVLVVDPSSCS